MGLICRVVAKGGCVVGSPYTSAFRSIFLLISLGSGGVGLGIFSSSVSAKGQNPPGHPEGRGGIVEYSSPTRVAYLLVAP